MIDLTADEKLNLFLSAYVRYKTFSIEQHCRKSQECHAPRDPAGLRIKSATLGVLANSDIHGHCSSSTVHAPHGVRCAIGTFILNASFYFIYSVRTLPSLIRYT